MSAGGLDTVGSPAFTDEESARYRATGWWSDSTLSDAVRHNAEHSPDRCAYADDPGLAMTIGAYIPAHAPLPSARALLDVASRGDDELRRELA